MRHLDFEIAAHLIEDNKTGRLKAITEAGRFHIVLLRLNRPQLITHRLARKIQRILWEKQQLLEQQNAELRRAIEAQERYIALLKSASR